MKFDRNLKTLDLNPSNVFAIYKDCLISKENVGRDPNNELPIKIFSKEKSGQDSPKVVFSRRHIYKHTNTINYLLGQLKVIHDRVKRFYSCNGICEI